MSDVAVAGDEPPTPPHSPATAPTAVPLLAPRDGVPPVVCDPEDLQLAVRRLAAGSGPVAVDAERASGYRYGQRAYLVQLRRAGAGTVLIDPVPLRDLSAVGAALATTEWVVHAASQDLPCLAELGMRPSSVFDTELAGRLLGHSRVGLGALVESELGLLLEKGHAAADWSTRPLPEPWLRYAALDVEVLVELRDVLATQLAEQGKTGWAEQEFAAIVAAGPPPPRVDPWRRTSGLHRIRSRRQLAVARSLWEARDRAGQARDISPGRVLPDLAIVAAALAMPSSEAALVALPEFAGRGQRRHSRLWWEAVERALAEPEAALPANSRVPVGPPPARAWPDRDPAAAGRLAACRAAMAELSERWATPVENLLAPDTLRRLCWTPPDPIDAGTVADHFRQHGARPWQVELITGPVVAALTAAAQPPD
ncbi:MAG: ribonuclease D [Actinomycetota bacterium]|nr:MAG: ribonuclease D [Actinomycetota bacterium]